MTKSGSKSALPLQNADWSQDACWPLKSEKESTSDISPTVSVPPETGFLLLTPTAAPATLAIRPSTTVPAIATPPIVAAECVMKCRRSNFDDIMSCFPLERRPVADSLFGVNLARNEPPKSAYGQNAQWCFRTQAEGRNRLGPEKAGRCALASGLHLHKPKTSTVIRRDQYFVTNQVKRREFNGGLYRALGDLLNLHEVGTLIHMNPSLECVTSMPRPTSWVLTFKDL